MHSLPPITSLSLPSLHQIDPLPFHSAPGHFGSAPRFPHRDPYYTRDTQYPYYKRDSSTPYAARDDSPTTQSKRRKLDNDPLDESGRRSYGESSRMQELSYRLAQQEYEPHRPYRPQDDAPWQMPPPVQPYIPGRPIPIPIPSPNASMRVQSLVNDDRPEDISSRSQPSTYPIRASPESDPDGKPFHCNVQGCDRKYKKLNGLIYHHQTAHSTTGLNDPKPFKCTMPGCDKAYRNSNGLAYHLENGHPDGAVFSGQNSAPKAGAADKPFVCPYKGCGKAYKNANGLSYHLSRGKATGHTVEAETRPGVKTFICAVLGCRKTYKSPQGLSEHIEKMHADMEPVVPPDETTVGKHECPSCMRQFRTSGSLDYHIITVHHHNPHPESTSSTRSSQLPSDQLGFDERQPHHVNHYETYHAYYDREEGRSEQDEESESDTRASSVESIA